jgi:hypothetical protein
MEIGGKSWKKELIDFGTRILLGTLLGCPILGHFHYVTITRVFLRIFSLLQLSIIFNIKSIRN